MKKYLNERNSKLFTKLFENQGVKVNEGDFDAPVAPDGPFRPPMRNLVKKADTTPEIKVVIKWVLDQVKKLTNGGSTDLEIKKAIELVLKDMKSTIGKVAQDTTSEVHVLATGEEEENSKTSEEE
jgi:hypothetical protein